MNIFLSRIIFLKNDYNFFFFLTGIRSLKQVN